MGLEVCVWDIVLPVPFCLARCSKCKILTTSRVASGLSIMLCPLRTISSDCAPGKMAAPIRYDSIRSSFLRPLMQLADHAVIGNLNGKFRNRDQRCAFCGKRAHGRKPSLLENCCPGVICIRVCACKLAESALRQRRHSVSELPSLPTKDAVDRDVRVGRLLAQGLC